MAVRIRIAATAAERDALFRMRHRVYVEQGGYMKSRAEHRIYDRFDAFPSTTNIIAVLDNEVIGGLRLAEPDAAGLPADEYFDFAPYVPATTVRLGSASMLCLDYEYHHRKRLMSSLTGMFYYLAMRRGLTHIAAPANPEIEDELLRTGYRRVAPTFVHDSGIPVSPMVLELKNVNDRFLSFIRVHQREQFLHSLDRGFYTAGETVVSAGDNADAAFIIIQGTARSESVDSHGFRQTHELGPGQMFGELSLVARRPHHETVIASENLDVMVLSASSFQKQLLKNPGKSLELLCSLGTRLLDGVSENPGHAVSLSAA